MQDWQVNREYAKIKRLTKEIKDCEDNAVWIQRMVKDKTMKSEPGINWIDELEKATTKLCNLYGRKQEAQDKINKAMGL